jgi:hypothetical protein
MITRDQRRNGGPQDARHVPLNRAQRLAQDAAEAAKVRAYQTHPDVVALRIEHVRSQVDRTCWAGIVLGLAFTMTNVQVFAAAGAAAWSLPWLAAWVLDPTVSLVLLAILRAEQVTARYQVRTGRWARGAKWFTLAATYVMTLLCLSSVGRVSVRAREVTCPKSWPFGVRGRPRWTQSRPRVSSRARLGRRSDSRGGVEGAEDLACDVALEDAPDVAVGTSFGAAAGDVVAGAGAAAPAGEHDGVQRTVEGTIAAAVEPVSGGASTAGREWADAGERGEGGFAAAASVVGPGDNRLGGRDRSDPEFGEQFGGEIGDDRAQLGGVGGQVDGGVADADRQAAGFGAAGGLFTGFVSSRVALDDVLEVFAAQLFGLVELAVGVVTGDQQRAELVERSPFGEGDLFTGAEQDPQCFAVAVRARDRQPVGVQAQCVDRGQVRVDRVGLAAAAFAAAGLFDLQHGQAGGAEGAGQADAITSGAFDGGGHSRARGLFVDPGQSSRRALIGVGHGQRRHCRAGWRGDLQGVAVAVGVGTHHRVHDIGQHGHSVARLLPAQGTPRGTAPVWTRTTGRHFCEESREGARGQASDQASQWCKTAPVTEKTGHEEGTPLIRSGQNTCGSSTITGADHGGKPDQNRRTTHSQNTWSSWAVGSTAGVVLHSVPPLLVFVAAEAVTDLRDKLTDAVTAAVNAAVRAADARTATGGHTSGTASVHSVHELLNGSDGGRPARRRTFEEYRAVARHAWSPDVEITPAWVRQVTGCSRGLSSRLAKALAADVGAVNGADGSRNGGDRP